MKTHKIKMAYTFKCTWEIKTKTKKEAIKIAEEQCGCITLHYHSSYGDDIVSDWLGDAHSEKELINVK